MPVSLLGGGAAAAGSAGLHVVTGVVAATFLSSYVLIGIDEVGMEVRMFHVFDAANERFLISVNLTVLSLSHYSFFAMLRPED